jgi:hypothetical protein
VATYQLPSKWADEDERDIVTALQILEEQEKAAGGGTTPPSGADGPQYSG